MLRDTTSPTPSGPVGPGLRGAPKAAVLFPALAVKWRLTLVEMERHGRLLRGAAPIKSWRRPGRGGHHPEIGTGVCTDQTMRVLVELGLVHITTGRGRGLDWHIASLTFAGQLIAAELAREPETAGGRDG